MALYSLLYVATLLLALLVVGDGISIPEPTRKGDRNPPPPLVVQENSFVQKLLPSLQSMGGLNWSEAVVERSVEGLGFHRTAVTSIKANLENSDVVPPNSVSRCEIMMVERISKDV